MGEMICLVLTNCSPLVLFVHCHCCSCWQPHLWMVLGRMQRVTHATSRPLPIGCIALSLPDDVWLSFPVHFVVLSPNLVVSFLDT